MPGASQIIMAKLIAHDPDDVVGARHVRRFGDFKRPDAATWDSQLQARGRRKSGLSFVVARFLHATGIHFAPKRCQGVVGVQGSACAAPLAFPDTGASPITSASARSASFTPAPVTLEIKSGVFFAARLSRSLCFFNSSGVTASILFSATVSTLSARCP